MSGRIRAMRGFPDIGPVDTPAWLAFERQAEQILREFGYQQIRLPIVEATELFARSVGEVTDIVEKEMFSFVDRDKVSMSLRPEGTASAVRMGIDAGLLHNAQQRLWYSGPMFRHERPQAGRYRQFHQLGVEVFGISGPVADVEVIALAAALFSAAGVRDALVLEINTLGSAEVRGRYRETLQQWLHQRRDALDEDSQRRIDSNPLRILDSKNPQTRAMLEDAPQLDDSLDEESRHYFAAVCHGLDQLGIAWRHNPHLVRGLDYYNHCVFEWTTDKLGAQGTVLAGGRYDGLVERLGGGAVPACGFGLGIERLLLLQAALGVEKPAAALDIYLCHESDQGRDAAWRAAAALREQGYAVCMDGGDGRLKGQLKRAATSGAGYRLVCKDGHWDLHGYQAEVPEAMQALLTGVLGAISVAS